jgi:hypothetical protein
MSYFQGFSMYFQPFRAPTLRKLFLLLAPIVSLAFTAAPIAIAIAASTVEANAQTASGTFLSLYANVPDTAVSAITDFTDPLPVPESNNLTLTAAKGEVAYVPFVMRSHQALKSVSLFAGTFSAAAATLPASIADIKLVATWYRANAGDVYYKTVNKTLLPDLLVNDAKLIKNDFDAQKSYLRITAGGQQTYVDVTDPDAPEFPPDAEIHDAPALVPFDMAAKSNRQVWVTVRVPQDAAPGEYHGAIMIYAQDESAVMMPFTLTVLPFALKEPLLEQAIYYRGQLNEGLPSGTVQSEFKSITQLERDFAMMLDHGIKYPTVYQGRGPLLDTYLSIMKLTGLATDRLYTVYGTQRIPTTATEIADLAAGVAAWRAAAVKAGFSDNLYFYGKDEAGADEVRQQLAAWQAIHDAGGKVFAAVGGGVADVDTKLLDIAVIPAYHNADITLQLPKFKARGAKLFNYEAPHSGIEDPSVYRLNHGFDLFNRGYEGVMIYAYQHSFKNGWNDFDAHNGALGVRDENFTYPSSDGPIDTVGFDGYRNAVNDLRYLATLASLRGWSVDQTRAWSTEQMAAAKDDYAKVRAEVIREILSLLP